MHYWRQSSSYFIGGSVHFLNLRDRFSNPNGLYQDGGLIIAFPNGHWEAVFLAFASQCIHTADTTGYPLEKTDLASLLGPTIPSTNDNYGKVSISTALVNAVNQAPPLPVEDEYVFLENNTAEDIDLTGWALSNTAKRRQDLSGTLKASRRLIVHVPNAPLSNGGAIITLLDNSGLKVHGVSHSGEQVAREGNLVFFKTGAL